MSQPLSASSFGGQSLILNLLLQLRVAPLSMYPSSSLSSSSSSWLSKSIYLLFVMSSMDFSKIRSPVHQDQQGARNSTEEIYTMAKSPASLISPVVRENDGVLKCTSPRVKRPNFLHRPRALQNHRPIPFRDEWLNDFNVAPHDATQTFSNHTIVPSPKSLPGPHYMDVHELSTYSSGSLKELAQEARQRIDQDLPHSGAMLFRNLHHTIHNASDFATFWNHVVESNNSGAWNPMTDHLSCYNRKRQRLGNAVDRVDTDVPTFTIGPHNEHSCNPRPSDKIFFYALQPAVLGGESLLRRNGDIVVPSEARKLVEQAGGLQFTRSYPAQQTLDSLQKEDHHPTEMSWQERTNTNQRNQAQEYFATQHWIKNVTFDQQDTLTAHTILPGFLEDQLWFNRIDYGFPVQLADGAFFPLPLQSQLKQQKWHETSAFKLQQGDWLVLDNLRVQHGRLPYTDLEGSPARQLLVTYTSSS